MMKKTLAVLLSGAMLAGMTTGAAVTAAADDAPTVTVSTWNELPTDDSLNMFKQCTEATGINVEYTVIAESDYSSKLNQMVATQDNSIDIMIVWENDLGNFAQVGGIEALDDYLADSTIDTDDMIDAVAKLSDGLGGTYGLPWCAATEIMYYNKDMFDAAGIEYPTNDWSYEDFLAAAEALTGDGVYGFEIPSQHTWWAGIGGAGDEIYDPATGQMVIGDGAVSFLTDCKSMVDAGIMNEPSSDTTDLFAAGKAAMTWRGSWQISSYGDSLGFNWDIATIPTNVRKYNTLHTGFYTINANSANKDAAWEVIEYLMGEEGQTINSKNSGNMSALKSIADEGAWKTEAAQNVITNWDAMTDSLAAGVFGYTCLPSGVTSDAVSKFESCMLGEMTPEEAVQAASDYAAETIGY